MSIPWFLKPDWLLHAEMLDEQAALNQSLSSSYATDQKQDKEIAKLQKRVSELELQLLALEKVLSEQGLLPPPPEPPAAEEAIPADIKEPARFPARTEETVACPRCGRRQRGDRDICYSCKTPFQYENE